MEYSEIINPQITTFVKQKITGNLGYCLARLYNDRMTPQIEDVRTGEKYNPSAPEDFVKGLGGEEQIKISVKGDSKSKLIGAIKDIKTYF